MIKDFTHGARRKMRKTINVKLISYKRWSDGNITRMALLSVEDEFNLRNPTGISNMVEQKYSALLSRLKGVNITRVHKNNRLVSSFRKEMARKGVRITNLVKALNEDLWNKKEVRKTE